MRRLWPKALILCLGISAALADQPVPVFELSVGSTAKLFVPSGTLQTLKLIPRSAEALELTIEQDAPDLQVSVIGPDKNLIRTARTRTAHKFLLSFPVATPGLLFLQIQSHAPNRGDEDGFITVEAEAVRKLDLDTRTEAEDAYLKAQEQRSAADVGSLQRSIELVRNARETWQTVGDLRGQVLALESEGDAWLARSKYQRALGAYARAEQLLGDDTPELKSVINGESRVYLEWWKSTPATELAARALKLSRAHHDIASEAEALANRAEGLYLVTRDDAASQDLDTALALIENLGQTRLKARIFRCKAWIEEDRGHLTRASFFMERSDELFRQSGEHRESLNSLSDIATMSGMQGDHYTAMLRHSNLAQLLRKSGDLAGTAFSLDNLGTDYSELNRDEDAIRYYLSAESIFARIDHASGRLTSMGHLCVTEIRLKRPRSALRYCSASRALAREIGDPKREAIAEWRMAKAYLALGRVHSAVEGFGRAASISQEVKDARFQALSLVDMGTALEELGDREAAKKLYRQAEALSKEAEDPGGQVEARFHLAELETALGRPGDAKEVLSGTLQLIEVQRSLVADDKLRSSYFASAKKSYELYIQLLMDESRKNPAQGWDRAALEVSEASHSRSLLDELISSGGRNEPKGNQVVRADLLKTHSEIERLYDQRLELMLEGDGGLLSENAQNLAHALDEYDRATDALDSPEHQPATGKPLSVPALVEKSRQSRRVYLEYALGNKESFAWIMDRGAIESHVLPGRQQIARAVRRWKSLVESRTMRPGEQFSAYTERVAAADKALPAVSSSLSCMLFGTFLTGEMTDLVIVPDDLLEGLSFPALPVRGCEKGNFPPVIEAHTVMYTPSLSVYFAASSSHTERQFKGEIALLADPVFDASDSRVKFGRKENPGNSNRATSDPAATLPRLSGTRAEALSIAALFPPDQVELKLDFSASLATLLRGDMSGYRIWHLATHGIADPGTSDFSGLVLSRVDPRGTPVYGYLHSRDIAQLKIDADLVVLSSCSSSIGTVTGEDGASGITYAFLHSGVKRVVSTLWNVDDDASRDLMLSFYRHLTIDHQEPERALKEAQSNLLHHSRFANPYFWAGYALTASAQ